MADDNANINIQNVLQVQVHEESVTPTVNSWQNAGLEILVELSKKGEIDPWDVDLVYVIDKFLGQIKDSDLKQAGDIIFFVSVLFRMKTENIYNREENQNDILDDFIDFESLEFEKLDTDRQTTLTPAILDRALVRNTRSLKSKKTRRVTLNDIVKVFQSLNTPKTPRKKKKTSYEDFEDDGIAIREDENMEALDIAHEENLEEKIKKLSEYVINLLEVNKLTTFHEIEQVFGNQVDTFLSALFLSHGGRTEIVQEEIYKDIYLRRLS